VAVLALLAVVSVAVGVMVTETGEEAVSGPVAVYGDETEALRALVNLGYIPSEAFDAEAYWSQYFNDLGLIPHEAYEAPLYTAEELETMRLFREGLLPAATLDSETFITKRLVNEGLIPIEAVR
jgi:hypothetical protein